MKKYVLFAAFVLLGGLSAFSQSVVELTVGIDDHTSTGPSTPKAPPFVPYVTLDDHQLVFHGAHPEYTLNIIKDGQLVYSTFVSSNASFVVLPTWLTGDCTLLFFGSGDYYLYGDITL